MEMFKNVRVAFPKRIHILRFILFLEEIAIWICAKVREHLRRASCRDLAYLHDKDHIICV